MGLPQAVEIPDNPSSQRVPASKQAGWYRRKIVPDVRTSYGTVFERASVWVFPWTRRGYPGFQRGVLSILGRIVTWGAANHWRSGRRRLPVDIAASLVEHIEARSLSGLALVSELRNYIAAEEGKLARRGPLSTVSFDAAGNPRTNQSKGGRVY